MFDLDGVLTDSEQLWEDVRAAYVRDRGGPWSERDQRALMGMSTPEWAAYVSERLGGSPPVEQVAGEVIEAMRERYDRDLPLLPGAADAVRRLAERFTLGLASSSPPVLIEAALERLGAADLFAAATSSEEVERGKPAPDVYLEAARRIGADPGGCVAVEDSSNGIRSARGAGMAVIAYPNRHYPPEPEALGLAASTIDSLAELTPAAVLSAAG